MPIKLPLEEMSAEEKIQAMESLWSDLCGTAGSTLSPVCPEDGIAATVYDHSRKGKHYILAGTRFSDRTIWRLKRYLPPVYPSMMKSNARIQYADKYPSSGKGGIFEKALRFIRLRVLG